MKKVTLLTIHIFLAAAAFAQKQSFDKVSYTEPKGWQQQQHEGGMQLSVTDKKTGAYAIIVITKATASPATANENFTNDWNKLVKTTVQVNGEPVMQVPGNEQGWNIITGSANYTDGAKTGAATLLTATGGKQTVSVVLMTNTDQYQNELVGFLNSLELATPIQNEIDNGAITNGASQTSVAGLWCDNHLEISGYYNGYAQYTAGYFRREYLFKEDGTYIFRLKNWSVFMKEILFSYESGTYVVKGNHLSIIPAQGRGEWWSKVNNNTTLWGSRLKAADYKLERMEYTFEIKYFSGSKNYSLIVNPNKTTERDGTYTGPTSFSYTKYEDGKSIIDNPPGFKTGVENKSTTAATPVQNKNSTASVNAAITGKIWKGTSSEKFTGAGTQSGHYTGGFSSSQYQFNTNGTYKFINVLASFYTDTKTYKYETGTYSVNGNQLTIKPVKGQNEEWTKIGKTSNGNSDVTNRAINETWGKKIKTTARKLETYTYTFSINKNGDQLALILQRSSRTEREGEGNISYYNETTATQSVNLPTN